MRLTTEESWSLTPREIAALRKVRDDSALSEMRHWAVERSDYRNVHFRGPGHTQAWTVDEILGIRPDATTDSFEREKQRMAAMALSMKQNRVPAALPAWARMTREEAAVREKRRNA